MLNFMLMLLLSLSSSNAKPYPSSPDYQENEVVSENSMTGTMLQCDQRHPCPPGAMCLYSRAFPGVKTCFFGSVPAKLHLGRCAIKGERVHFRFPQGLRGAMTRLSCDFDQECPLHQRCCEVDGGRTCIQSLPIPSTPTITPLITGSVQKTAAGTMSRTGTATLVQSNGLNLLVDAGTPQDKITLLTNLKDMAGLYPDDIGFILASHGHPDHFGPVDMFPDTPLNVGYKTYIGNNTVVSNPLEQSGAFFVNQDPNLELLFTPGHTVQDTTLVVRNVPGMGTVAVSGDLFYYRDDDHDSGDENDLRSSAVNFDQQQHHRKRVACMVDYVIPGHGSMYKVDSVVKQSFGC